MIEAILHIPHLDNAGNDTKHDRYFIEQKLLQAFGGLSVHPCTGAWINEEGKTFIESMFRYIVAMEATSYNIALFEKIATCACIIMQQEAIYYKIGKVVHIAKNPTSPRTPNASTTQQLQ